MNEEKRTDQVHDTVDDPGSLEAPKGRRAFASVRRELSEEELSTPAVQKMLIDDIERLEREHFSMSEYRDRYYKADKIAAILEEKDKGNIAVEVMFGVCLTLGGAVLSFASANSSSLPNAWSFVGIAIGCLLIVGGVVSKVVRR